MISIRTAGQLNLILEQPNRFRLIYQLRAGSEILGKMYLQVLQTTVARVESGDGAWEFSCTNFIMPRISIRSVDLAYIGSFEGRRNGSGSLEFLDGQRFAWTRGGLRQDEWWFSFEDDRPVVRYRPEMPRSRTGLVEISPSAFYLDEITPLVFLGWYIIYLIAAEQSGFSVPGSTHRSWSVQ